MLPNCFYCSSQHSLSAPRKVVMAGFFRRSSDGKKIQRFLCGLCQRTFSLSSFSPCFQQKKRNLNGPVFHQLASCTSQRRTALILGINRKTVVRKFLFLGKAAEYFLLSSNLARSPATQVQFDDLETFEHSKCKPLSVIMAVEEKSRRILGFRVARMPAKGHLAALARKKYGLA